MELTKNLVEELWNRKSKMCNDCNSLNAIMEKNIIKLIVGDDEPKIRVEIS